MAIPINDKGRTDPTHWNIKGIREKGKGSFQEWYKSIHGETKTKHNKHKPTGRALALSKKLLGK